MLGIGLLCAKCMQGREHGSTFPRPAGATAIKTCVVCRKPVKAGEVYAYGTIEDGEKHVRQS